MKQLEDRLYFSSHLDIKVSEFEAKKLSALGRLEEIYGTITTAFFGSIPDSKVKYLYYGLNIIVELEGTQDILDFHSKAKASARYSKMQDIEGIMRFYDARTPLHLEGKFVKACFAKKGKSRYLVALAPLKPREETR